MAISQDPSVLAAASRCFDTCVPPGDQQVLKTYLLAQLAGVTDPKVVANNARCFSSCIPPGSQVDVQAYLAAVLQGGSTDPSTLLNNATCFRSCVPPGASASVANYALASKAGGSTDPSTLANLARCFSSCIPPGMQSAAQSYLLGVQAGITDPAVALTNARCFRCFDSNDPTVGDAMITRWVVGNFPGPGGGGGGGGPTPPPPPTTDPLVTSWQTRAIANGGAPSAATLTCLDTFCKAIRAQAYFTKLKSINFIAPDDLRCAMTPLIVHAQDSGLWQACTAATSTGATTIVNGTFSTLDATGWRCDYAVTPAPGTNNFNPAAILSSVNNGGITVYQTQYDGLHSTFGEWMGAEDATDTNALFGAVLYFGNTYFEWLSNASQMAQAHNGKFGYYSYNTTAANARNVYFANSINAHASIMSSAGAISGILNALAIVFNGSNQNGTTLNSSSNHYSFFAMHDGLTSAESADFFNRIQTLRTCLGTGFV